MTATTAHRSSSLVLAFAGLASLTACQGNIGGDGGGVVGSSNPIDEAQMSPGDGALVYALDVSHWTDVISEAEVRCWWDQEVRHVIVGTQNLRVSRQQLEMAHDGGMTLDLYVYLLWDYDISAQVTEAVELAAEYPVGRIWLDAEEEPGGRSATQLEDLLQEALSACGEVECGIYTANWWWGPAMAGSTAFSHVPLWYAYYDDQPSLATWANQAFGGWDNPTGKQYDETYVCGLNVDVNTMAVYATPPPPPEPLPPPNDGPPDAPTSLYPDDGIHIGVETVKMLSNTISGATSYAFEVQHYQGGSFKGYYTYETSQSTREVSPVFDNRVYRFRVRAESDYGWGPWSDWAVFEYGHANEWPDAPPADDPPADDPPADDPPADDPPADDPPADDPPADDPPPPPPPSGSPVNLQPSDGSSFASGSVHLSCDPLSGASQYAFEIQFHNGSSYVPYYTYQPGSPSQTFWPVSAAPYRWRVRAKTGGVWGPDSNWITFDFGI